MVILGVGGSQTSCIFLQNKRKKKNGRQILGMNRIEHKSPLNYWNPHSVFDIISKQEIS